MTAGASATAPDHARRFDRLEIAGSFGDLGTFLPIVVAMILINHLSPSAVLLSFGLFYVFTGCSTVAGSSQPLRPSRHRIANPSLVTVRSSRPPAFSSGA
jgi:hypothetical protein